MPALHALDVAAILVSLTAILAYLNYHFVRLPTTMGVMLIALMLSLVTLGLEHLDIGVEHVARNLLSTIDFNETLMHGMLSFLLFAGALHVNLDALMLHKGIILTLATVSVIVSTFVVGTALYLVLPLIGLTLPYAWCAVFGALISPTDPIAALGILRNARVPKSLEVSVSGEALFNDGIGVVLFLVLVGIAAEGDSVSFLDFARLLLVEGAGGALLGLGMGVVTYWMIKSVENYQVEVLLTLALVMGGYGLALALGTSGPIAIVVAGLFIGNHGRQFAMSESSRAHLDTFWELLDQILNALLFVLIGLELLVLTWRAEFLLAGVVAIPVVLLARWVSVAGPLALFGRRQRLGRGAVTVMTWGGLRGGVSVALALSLPAGEVRDLLLAATYIVVVFSIFGQGLTLGRVARRAVRAA
jgi:CPA1 family monovalent cation:H+ antiporter